MAQGKVEEGLDSTEANVELAQSQVEDGFLHLQSSDVDEVIDIHVNLPAGAFFSRF